MELCEGMISSWDWDITHRKLYSTNLWQILGYHDNTTNQADTNMSRLVQLIHPEDYPIVRSAVVSHLKGLTDHYEAEFRIQHKNGYWIWMQDIAQVIARDQETRIATRMVGIRRNINSRKAAVERRMLATMLFQHVSQGVFILDHQFRIQNINPYFEKISGFSKEELIGTRFMNRDRYYNPAVVQAAQNVTKTLETVGVYEGEFWTQRKNGEEYPAWLHINTVYDDQQRKTHYIGIIGDLTERRRSEQRLSYLANYDSLTDLPNRTYFKEYLHQYILQSIEKQSSFAVLLLNLDRFRLLNNLLGTKGADQLLKQVATRFVSLEIRTGVIAHLGSDDFGIVLEYPENDPQKLKEYSQKLQQLFDAPFNIDKQEMIVTLSIGIALFPQHAQQVDSLFYYAENALKEAKRLGGNTFVFAVTQQNVQPFERISLEHSLRKALSSSQFEVYYQAKIDADNKKIVGFEALVRWNHPKKGLVSPVEFIGLAEEIGVIGQLGEFVLDQACAQIKAWADMGYGQLKVSVNVSALQLQRGNFLATLDRILIKHQIVPMSLELEITESLLMDEQEKVRNILQEIRNRQVTIALDDFGTGYSSLSYLGLYPIDVIKIDRSFIIQMMNSPQQKAIVLAILAMSNALNMEVVAEGVETEEQARYLCDEGCDVLQGYLVSKPRPASEATLLLRDGFAQLDF
ncbi:MAG: EAL domain-containing protein [Gammaproteobacteria bacterium]|nr:EAL domain-containing protein [Gammaproteobacteria bacterium]